MEKRKSARRKTGERGVGSDAESTVSTRSSNSSNSNSSNTSWKQRQRRLKASSRDKDDAMHPDAERERRTGEANADGHLKSLETSLGAILETTEAQMVMILLIVLDVGCTALEIHFQDQLQLANALQQLNSNGKEGSSEVAVPLLVRVATQLVESFTGFTLVLFLIELAVLLAAFRRKFFAHAGYVLDLTVVSISLTLELYTQAKAVRLLGVLRVWRVLRLVRRLVDQERAAHDATCLLLEQEELKLLHVRMQKDAAHESLKREYESREGLEQLLRGYKDEIATLKEALQIAAQAVAEATIGESAPVHTDLYDVSETAAADSSFGSYPAVGGGEYEYGEEFYQQQAAAVHPATQTEVVGAHWQESEEGGSEYHHQEAAAVHPAELQELEEDHQEAAAAHPTEVPSEFKAEHSQESVRDVFEDAVGE
ncbi:hypothetical protein KRP22_002807 [Phytophthora ramorum]|uniref:uncharacterized protein n=1 Tax=Phytophthora ramorum TaxID=164328 RepID=UPI003098B995|nr:hypothetical protein KRP23_644 [Phytophthora ramorum]KAH7503402.1 hypothetical protein KRP22_6454 [Phytophthora ramorum]